tara:strand:+ start:1046 stop:1315 length:270 start_codon:yes stop_codon:yes gene_type:complete
LLSESVTPITLKILASSFDMGGAKRRKDLGIPLRNKLIELSLPVLDKENIKKKLGISCTKIQLFHLFLWTCNLDLFVGTLKSINILSIF